MKRKLFHVIALTLTLSFPMLSAHASEQSAPAPAVHFTGDNLSKDAKISLEDAKTIALKEAPGQITDQELEAEAGGSGLRYSFDIKQGSVTREVGVDAKTGKILENSKEGPHPD